MSKFSTTQITPYKATKNRSMTAKHSFLIGCIVLGALFADGFTKTRCSPSVQKPPVTADLVPTSHCTSEPVFDRRSAVSQSLKTTGILSLFGGCTAFHYHNQPARAESLLTAPSSELTNGLLQSRVEENLLQPPTYGMEVPDIVYPDWFSGSWNVESTTSSVQAPCGVELFGGNATYQKAQSEVDTKLIYQSRFVNHVADREYNVASIARAAFGSNSVLNLPLVSPNKLTAILALSNSSPNSILQVDLFVVNRRQETLDDSHFDCSEVVREVVSRPGSSSSSSSSSQPPVLKEVETTSLYTKVNSNSLVCRQRSATFLLPSVSDLQQYKRWEYARGRPIDVRFYDVVYTKRS